MAEALSLLIAEIVAALSNTALYSTGHPAVARHAKDAVGKMQDMFNRDGELSFTVLSDILVCNGERVALKGVHIGSFIERLRRRGVEKVVFRRGIEPEEFQQFVIFLASSGNTPPEFQHISVGIVELGPAQGDEDDAGGGGPLSEGQKVLKQSIPQLKGIHSGIAESRELDVEGLDAVVGDLMAALKKDMNVFHAVIPFKFHSEYTYAHIVNVSAVSMFLAGRLGIKGDLLRDVGMAGLLHDVGKMFVSNKIIDKPGKLDPGEWERMRAHPVLGARYLATVPNGPSLAMIAAFEHHMKFDGSGYPATKMRPRRQHIVSQIIAVADVFDALRAERSYQKPMEMGKVVKLLEDLAGKDFNPLIVKRFIASIGELF